MAYALQQLINGISLGMIYGLIAVGYTMVYGIIGMINFAHGDVFMIGAFIALITVLLLPLGGMMGGPAAILLVLLVSMAFTALYGWSVERVAYRPLRGSFRLAPLISRHRHLHRAAELRAGQPGRPGQADRHAGAGRGEVMRDGNFVVQFSYIQMLIIAVTLGVLAVFTILVTRTPLGRAMRACEQDSKMARCSASTPTARSA